MTVSSLYSASQELAMHLSLFPPAPFNEEIVSTLLPTQDPEVIEDLVKLRLVYDLGGETYTLPPYNQLSLREALEASSLRSEARHTYCRAVVAVIKSAKESADLSPYIEHLKVVALELEEWVSNEDLIYPFLALSRFYQNHKLCHQASFWCEQCLLLSEPRLGEDHPDVAVILNQIATLYCSQGKYTEAEPLYLRALAIREKQLGEKHPDVAATLNGMAVLYESQEKYEKAEPLYLRALKIWKKQLGEEHLHVATGLNNLASFYQYAQQEYKKAEPLYWKALAIREKQLGKNHASAIKILDDLEDLYYALYSQVREAKEERGKITERKPQ